MPEPGKGGPAGAETMALVLSSHGLQRMTARTLAALLFTEQPTITMGELAEQLHASIGAISTALRILTEAGLAERVPSPGSRRDHFRLCENAWANQYTNQNQVTNAVLTAAREGMAATSPDELAHHRLAQMHAFYTFLMDEIPALLERWHEQSPPS